MSTTRPSVVLGIHLAPATRLPMRSVDEVRAVAPGPDAEALGGPGLIGDRYQGTRHRHVSVQAQDDLDAAAVALAHPITPASTRRNITISRGPVPSTPGSRMHIGPVVLEAVRIAAPCRLLDDGIAVGARTALRRRAGTIFRILEGGVISVGDPVSLALV